MMYYCAVYGYVEKVDRTQQGLLESKEKIDLCHAGPCWVSGE